MRERGLPLAEVVTGEAVVLEVPCARFPSRLLALGLDLIIQVVLLFILFVIVGLAVTGDRVDGATGGAIALTVSILIVVGYPVLWETLTRGGSPGKFALGLRVVSDDGGPERFRQALVRGLAAVVEIWLLLGFPALISSLLSQRGKRLGDLFAGTFVIQQRLPAGRGGAALPVVSPELAAWGARLEMSGLTDQTRRDGPPVPGPASRADPGRAGRTGRAHRRRGPRPGQPAAAAGHARGRLPERGPHRTAQPGPGPADRGPARGGRGMAAASGGSNPTADRRSKGRGSSPGTNRPPRAGSFPRPDHRAGRAHRRGCL